MSKFKLLLLGSALSLLALTPTAFANDDEEMTPEEDVIEETTMEDELSVEESFCYDCGYYGPSIYMNVSATAKTTADNVNYYGNYYVEGADSKEDAADTLIEAYSNIREVLEPYGTVRRTGIYSYLSYDYSGESSYSGSLSIKVSLNDVGDALTVEDLLYGNGFDAWMEILIDNMTAVELSTVDDLKEAIDNRTELYEELLGYELGEITGLSIWSWADSSTFDPDTGMVNVFVSADVNFQPQSLSYSGGYKY